MIGGRKLKRIKWVTLNNELKTNQTNTKWCKNRQSLRGSKAGRGLSTWRKTVASIVGKPSRWAARAAISQRLSLPRICALSANHSQKEICRSNLRTNTNSSIGNNWCNQERLSMNAMIQIVTFTKRRDRRGLKEVTLTDLRNAKGLGGYLRSQTHLE